MIKTSSVLLLLLGLATSLSAQKKQPDTVRKYLDSRLAFTNKANMELAAMAFREGDHWKLVSVYEDTTPALRVWFKDDNLTIKDGPFTLYHRKKIKGLEGHYTNNIRQGTWKSWHSNGQLKDSGNFYNNHLVGTWYTWNEAGQLAAIQNYTASNEQIPAITAIAQRHEKRPSILASDTSIGDLNGTSITYHPDGKMKDSGSYVANIKEGIWKTWYPNGQPESIGMNSKGMQDGDWEYFRENGHLSSKEKYVKGKVAKLECYDEQGNFSGNACPILKPPVALGKFMDFEKYVLDNLYWPEELKRSPIVGTVELEYTINALGVMENLKVTRSPHQAMSAEVLRFFKTLQWSPAMSHNRPISQKMKYSVPFYR